MGFLSGGGSTVIKEIAAPTPITPPDPVAPTPVAVAPVGANTGNQAARIAAGMGFANTIQTGPQGYTGQVATAMKTLLGQ